MTARQKKLAAWCVLAMAIVFSLLAARYIGVPMVRFVSDPQGFRDWVSAHGFGGKLIFIGMVVLQVIIALIPGEPLEIGAGYAFGALEGTILALAAATVLATVLVGALASAWSAWQLSRTDVGITLREGA